MHLLFSDYCSCFWPCTTLGFINVVKTIIINPLLLSSAITMLLSKRARIQVRRIAGENNGTITQQKAKPTFRENRH